MVIMNNLIKLALIVAVGYFGVQALGGGGGEMPKSTQGLVARAKTKHRKLVILMTGADWCGACKAMENGMLNTPEWQGFAEKEVVFEKFDYPNGGEATTRAHEELKHLPGFQGYPTMLVVNGNGKILDMRVGFSGGPGEYISWIKSL